jgi:hypothetical protein
MEENKFEKQVQQKMDEFSVRPSEDVWKKIEVRIEKKKSSKWGLLILILFFITAGGFWLWNGLQQRVLQRDQVQDNKKLSAVQKDNPQKNNTAADSANNKNNTSKERSFKEKDVYKRPVTKNEAPALSGDAMKLRKRLLVSVTPVKSREMIGIITAKAEEEKEAETSELKLFSKNEQVNYLNDSTTVTLEIPVDLLSEDWALMNNILKKPISKDEIPKCVPGQFLYKTLSKPVAKNKWHLGIEFSGGISGISNSVLKGGNYANYLFMPNASTGQVTQPYNYSLSFKNGFAYFVGVFADRSLTRKMKISLGLNFRTLQSTYKPGADTGVSSYLQSAVRNFHAHYNFIDLPINIKFLVGKASRPAILLQGGIMVSQMTGSNALQFDQSRGYFRDNSLFNKTQFGFNGAAYTTLFFGQKYSVYVGPYFYYGLSKIASQGLYNKKHFSFAGLRSEISFGK